jgi:hypothetical protein
MMDRKEREEGRKVEKKRNSPLGGVRKSNKERKKKKKKLNKLI